jgi:hypothetical protein
MRVIGIITTVLIVVIAVCAAVLAVRSIPDIRRYLKIRSM